MGVLEYISSTPQLTFAGLSPYSDLKVYVKNM